MRNQPLISIITASYNSEKTIANTIESILSINYKNYEYIIIDGGSTDSTCFLIKQYEPLFNGKLKWISEPDNGIYDAWNKALRIMDGDWCCFVGSDDMLLPDSLSLYAQIINENPEIEFISGKVQLVTSSLEPMKVFGEPWSKKMLNYCCVAHVGSLHRKTLFEKVGFYSTSYRISSDYELLLKGYKMGIETQFVDRVIAKMRDGGVSNTAVMRTFLEVLHIKNCLLPSRRMYNRYYYIRSIVGYYIKQKLRIL